MILSIQNEREWVRFCDHVLRRPEMATDEGYRGNTRRAANRDRLDAEIRDGLAELTLEEFINRLREAAIAYGRLNSVEDFARHAQLRLVGTDTPTGPVQLPAPPIRRVGERSVLEQGDVSVPALGAHSAALRDEFHPGSAAPG